MKFLKPLKTRGYGSTSKRRWIISVAIAVFACHFFAATLLAADIWVPDDQPAIQTALDVASAGDTVWVRDGTYLENIVWPAVDGITLQSESGPNNCIIDGFQQIPYKL